MTKAYLLSRTLDPLLAVFTGLFAFYLNQNNPRTAPPPGHTLQELLIWKWAESKKIREARDKEASEEWEKQARMTAVTRHRKLYIFWAPTSPLIKFHMSNKTTAL
ncbi:uncharacterized protein IAS62_003844 [Cryptococcus decagattii]|uniref:Uncharacterized protein n=1 Tax=Cryptococcus decagattii TaxID=1859122 RepID=A0ABZ2AXC4_9TREE